MNIKTGLTEPECDYFRSRCNFTDEERAVFDLRVKGKSIIEICFALAMSERTVSRRIASVSKKINKII